MCFLNYNNSWRYNRATCWTGLSDIIKTQTYKKQFGTGTRFRTAKYFPSYRTAAAQCIDQFWLVAAQPLFGN
jgi:hypothetical protein